MDDGCRDYFSGKLIKNGGFLVSVAGKTASNWGVRMVLGENSFSNEGFSLGIRDEGRAERKRDSALPLPGKSE